MGRLNFPTGAAKQWVTWPELKALNASKFLSIQCAESDLYYEVYLIEHPMFYVTIIYRDTVPDGTISQVDNDAWKLDFENNFKNTCNGPLVKKDAFGISVTTLDAPKEDDKKPVFVLSPASEGFNTWICGADDNLTASYPDTGRGTGNPFRLEWDGTEDFTTGSVKEATYSFIESMEIHDGQIMWKDPVNWTSKDKFSFGIIMDATPCVENTSSLGNANKYPLGPGMNMIFPAAGDGDWDVDLSTAVPVPTTDKDGYWDIPNIISGDIVSSSTPGAARYHLFDFQNTGWLLRNIQMGNPLGTFDIDVYKSEYFHKSWHLYWNVKRMSSGSAEVSGWLFCFRRYVT